jgi:hypothetical protein
VKIDFPACIGICVPALTLSGCAVLLKSFTTENVMKVHEGMSSNEILAMFGTPEKNVSQAVCGASTGHAWT